MAHCNSCYPLGQALKGGRTNFQQNRQDFHEPVEISKAFKTKLLDKKSIQYQANEHLA